MSRAISGRLMAYLFAAMGGVISAGCGRHVAPTPDMVVEVDPRIVSTNSPIAHGLNLKHSSLARLSDGTIYIAQAGLQVNVLKIDPNGRVSEMNFKSQRVARDKQDNAYFLIRAGILKVRPTGEASMFVGRRIADDQIWTDEEIDGDGENARFAANMRDMAIDAYGNIYVQEAISPSAYVKKITPNGHVSLYARTSIRENVNNFAMGAFAVDSKGNMYLGGVNFVRKVSPDGVSSIVAGSDDERSSGEIRDGAGSEVVFGRVISIAIDEEDNLYVDGQDCGIRKIDKNGVVRTIPGTTRSSRNLVDGEVIEVGVCPYWGIDLGPDGSIYFVDDFTNSLRRLQRDGTLTTIVRGD